MKINIYTQLICGLINLVAAGLAYQAYSFSESDFLLKEAEHRYKIKVKSTDDPEYDRKLKIILLKEYLLSKFLADKPEIAEKTIQRYLREGSLYIIEVPETNVKLLNISKKRCPLPSAKDQIASPVSILEKNFCFSEDNVAYFGELKEARFRIIPISTIESITDAGVQSELKARLKEELKALAVAEYIEKHKGVKNEKKSSR